MPSSQAQKNYQLPIFLPEAFQTNISIQREILTQSSRLFAWSWCSVISHTENPALDQEKALKRLFVKLLKEQGNKVIACQRCGDTGEMGRIKTLSDNIKNLLAGHHNQINMPGDKDLETIQESGAITLKDVLKELSGEDLVFAGSSDYIKHFIDNVLIVVSFDSYGGNVVKNPETTDESDIPEYIAVFPYPPRPALGPETITLTQLENWAQAKKSDGTKDTSYIPPAYICTVSCS